MNRDLEFAANILEKTREELEADDSHSYDVETISFCAMVLRIYGRIENQ